MSSSWQQDAKTRPPGGLEGLWFDLGQEGVHWQAAAAVVVCVLGYVLFRSVVIRALDRVAAATDNDLDDRLVQFARRFSGWVFLFLGGLWVLHIYDIPISPLIAGAGIMGIAIGFAAKEVLADILAGIFLIADRPMRTGDRIKIERIGKEWGGWGDVLDIGLRRTRIRNSDGVIVNYPNSMLANSVITNFSFENTPMRVRIRFQVGYDADLDLVKRVAVAAVQKTEKVLDGSAEMVTRSLWDVNRGHGTGGILIEGRYRIDNVRDRTKVRSAVFDNLIRALREAGIELAVPVIDLRKP